MARTGSLAVLAGLLLAGCGGARQDATEPSGTFPVSVVGASFPTQQHVSRSTVMRVQVRNTGHKAVPDIAVSVHGFDFRSTEPGLADPTRPLWVVDEGPRGGDTAYVSTWALGALPAGQTRTFEWRVTPVMAGRHLVRFEVAAGLNGKARARTSQGRIPGGSFAVQVSDAAPSARVDPSTGAVIPGR